LQAILFLQEVLDLLSTTLMVFFSQGPDAAFQDWIYFPLLTIPFLGLMVLLQESFQTAVPIYGLRPANNRSPRYIKVLGYMAFIYAFFQ